MVAKPNQTEFLNRYFVCCEKTAQLCVSYQHIPEKKLKNQIETSEHGTAGISKSKIG